MTLPDSPAPVTKSLEDIFHPTPMSIAQACLDVLKAEAQVTSHLRDVQEAFAGSILSEETGVQETGDS